VLSVGKIAAIVYGCIGLLIGAIVAMASVLGCFAGMLSEEGHAAGVIGMFLGVGAVIVLPVFYGCLGALIGMLVAAIYNVAARFVGGIEIEID
jgi:hypothetical protein